MSLDPVFAESLVHVPTPWYCRLFRPSGSYSGHKIAGIRLRHLTYWHVAQLDIHRSPFGGITESERDRPKGLPSLNQVLWAIAIARSCWPHRAKVSRLLRWRVAWGASRGLSVAGNDVGERHGIWLIRQALLYFAYISDYLARPTFGQRDDSEPVQSPWYLFEVVSLMRNFGLSETQAWNSQVGYSAWKNAAYSEAGGTKLDLLTPELREAFAKAGIQL